MRKWSVVVASALLMMSVPSMARAEGFIAPYVGTLFGGTLGKFDVKTRPMTVGVALGSMGEGILGFEADVAFAPDFFEKNQSILIGDTSVTTIMGNVLLTVPMGPRDGFSIRPYGAAGVGAIRQRMTAIANLAEFKTTDFGYNLGGGAMMFFTPRFGVRADVRYFRNFEKSDKGLFRLEKGTFSFSRAYVGAVLTF